MSSKESQKLPEELLALTETSNVPRGLIEQLPSAVAAVDVELRYLACSEPWRQRILNGAKDYRGTFLTEALPNFKTEWEQSWYRTLQGESVRLEEQRVYFSSTRQEWVNIQLTPWNDQDGVIRGLFVALEFVTEQVAQRHRIAESEERLQRAVDGATDGLWDWDLQSNCVWCSPQFHALLGREAESLDGDCGNWRSLVHPDDLPTLNTAVSDHLSHESILDLEIRLAYNDGHFRWFRLRGRAERDKSGRPLKLSGSVQDVTERKTAQFHLRRSNEELEKFAYAASHDLTTPLRAIRNLANWVIEDSGDTLPAEAQKHLRMLDERAESMQQLLMDLLEYSRIGRQAERRETVNTEILVKEAFRLNDLNGQYQLHLATTFPLISAERSTLSQVFGNLIGNAIKYHDKPEGNIEVSAHIQGDFLEFVVKDDGPGIPKRYHEKVFEMFERIHSPNESQGSGMGLAIVKKAAEQQGGSVWLESEEGEGTAVHVRWPYNKEDVSDE